MVAVGVITVLAEVKVVVVVDVSVVKFPVTVLVAVAEYYT